MESLKHRWKQLNLSSDEDNENLVDDNIVLEEIRKGKNSIIGKLHAIRNISNEVIRTTMLKVWKTTQPFSVRDINLKTYFLSFKCQEEMQRVMLRQP